MADLVSTHQNQGSLAPLRHSTVGPVSGRCAAALMRPGAGSERERGKKGCAVAREGRKEEDREEETKREPEPVSTGACASFRPLGPTRCVVCLAVSGGRGNSYTLSALGVHQTLGGSTTRRATMTMVDILVERALSGLPRAGLFSSDNA